VEGHSGFTNEDKFLTGTPIIPRNVSPSAVGPHMYEIVNFSISP